VLIEMLAALPESEVALTTNGALLAQQAEALAAAGLSRVTVSLDAVDDDVFHRFNDVRFPVEDVLNGIDTAAATGLDPIKINAVIKKGVNDGHLIQLAEHFKGSQVILRFIEYMDVGTTNGWRMNDVFSAAEMVERLKAYHSIEPIEPNHPGEVAKRWRYTDGGGEIGFITSVTQPFCGDCSRARLSADGRLFTCLFAAEGFDVRELLRNGSSDEALADRVRTVWTRRRDRYSELRTLETSRQTRVEMSYIGG
jgi:cyclic pyranopterin phosphate synthase